ncbi:collagenase-like [Eurosta solidaginis]|uniref:collagenase-like n=1 Tax=Eurosta solidaginis TaxID=178769 RepID=UPI003530CC07
MKLVIALSLLLCIASAFENRASRSTLRERLGSMVQKVDVSPRITNGQTAAANEIPYQAGLALFDGENEYFCGGSLISKIWVLTAAHCTLNAVRGIVYLGSIYPSHSIVELHVNERDINCHPQYNVEAPINDIALIKIPSVTYSAAIQRVRLPKCASSYSNYVDETVVASGWGDTSDTSSSDSPVLQFGSMKVISNEECAREYPDINTGILCTSTVNRIGNCDGDSGGPLVLASSNIQIGIIGFHSQQGCEAGLPAGHTRITSYLGWIQGITRLRFN